MENSSHQETLRNVSFVGTGEILVVKSTDYSSKRRVRFPEDTWGLKSICNLRFWDPGPSSGLLEGSRHTSETCVGTARICMQ